MVEAGAGGGHGDLNQQHELKIDDGVVYQELMSLCMEKLHDQPNISSSVIQMLKDATSNGGAAISLSLSDFSSEASTHSVARGADEDALDEVEGNLPLERLVFLLAKRATKIKARSVAARTDVALPPHSGLPKQITFPYSRHASYGELCILVKALMPRNIYPCTVDKSNWGPEHTMSYLFGHFYPTSQAFGHDTMMLRQYTVDMDNADSLGEQTQYQEMETQRSAYAEENHTRAHDTQASALRSSPPAEQQMRKHRSNDEDEPAPAKRRKRSLEHFSSSSEVKSGLEELTSDQMREAVQRMAYNAALGNSGGEWSLVSVDGHGTKEEEL